VPEIPQTRKREPRIPITAAGAAKQVEYLASISLKQFRFESRKPSFQIHVFSCNQIRLSRCAKTKAM
jgi:hypothetical protein